MSADGIFEDEETSLQFPDLINRGIEVAAQKRDFNLLVSSVGLGHDDTRRIFALARKSDGLILHDRVLDPGQVGHARPSGAGGDPGGHADPGHGEREQRQPGRHAPSWPGTWSATTATSTLAYLGGHADSPDNLARHAAFSQQVSADGAQFVSGPVWQGNYTAAGGARVIENLLAGGGAASPGDRVRERPDRARGGATRCSARHRRARRRSPSPASTTSPWPGTCTRS